MGKEERKQTVLRLLEETDLALPPKVIFVNLELRGATFSRNTVQRHLSEMLEDGYVERVRDEGYYRITEAGRKYLAGELED